MKGKHIPCKALHLVFFLCFIETGDYLYAEKIKIKIEDGVTVVYNPKNPVPPPGTKTKLILKEELCIGDDVEEYLFDTEAASVSMAVDEEGNIYTVDPQLVEVRKFNRQGNLLNLFGKKGKGPEEMFLPSSIRVTAQNELMFIDRGNSRITFYSLEGKFLRYIPTYKFRLGRTKIDSKGNVVADIRHVSGDEKKQRKVLYEIKRYNQKLEPLFTIASIDMTEESNSNDFTFGPLFYWQITKNDNVILGHTKNYEIHIINPEGKIIRKIKKEFDPVKVTKEEESQLPNFIRERYNLPKYHTGFLYFTVDEEGRIFARTWERTKDKEGYFYDVFDSEGRYIAKIPINAFVKLWIKGKLYTAEETEDGFPVIKRYNVIWK